MRPYLAPLRQKSPRISPKFPNLPLDTPVLFIIIAHMNIKRYTRQATNDGKILVDFLVDNIQGSAPHVTINHKFKSVEWLAKLGGFIPETAVSPSENKNSAPSLLCDNKSERKPPVTEKQILHFEIARLIKQETQDGKTAIDFLARVVAKGERPKSGENFTVAARMRATRELLIRGFGSSDGNNRRILSGDTEDLGSDLAKRIRGCSNDGAELVHLLVNAMENKTPEADSKGAPNPYPKFERQRKTNPAEGFTASQRVWAACELLRRAYDIRTDHITPADIQAYRNAQPPAADNAADADSSPGIDRTGITPKDIQAETPTIARASKAGANAATRDKSEKRPTTVKEKPDHDKQLAVAKNIAATEKPDAVDEKPATITQKRDDGNQPAAIKEKPAAGEQPAAATANIALVNEKSNDAPNPDSAPAPETRASRRRQKRAARKAQKRAANTPARSVYPEDIANIEAYKQRLQARSDAIRDAKLRNVDIRKIPELKRHITPEEVAAFQRQPGSLYNRTREMYKEKYGEYPFPDDIPPNARSP